MVKLLVYFGYLILYIVLKVFFFVINGINESNEIGN